MLLRLASGIAVTCNFGAYLDTALRNKASFRRQTQRYPTVGETQPGRGFRNQRRFFDVKPGKHPFLGRKRLKESSVDWNCVFLGPSAVNTIAATASPCRYATLRALLKKYAKIFDASILPTIEEGHTASVSKGT